MTHRVPAYHLFGSAPTGALIIVVLLYTSLSGFSQPGPIITFDAPGAGTGANQGTFAVNINDLGESIGWFVDAAAVYHGFVRYPDGSVVIINAPGAGATPGSGEGSLAYSINVEGTIVGQYQDANSVYHCFVRCRDGRVLTFDAPGAGTGPNQGSVAVDVNWEDAIAGYTVDNNNVQHGFVRSRSGTVTTFDAPDAGTGSFQGTVVTLESGLNPRGELIGWYFDANYQAHGYLRKPNGVIISFDPPGSVSTFPGSIDLQGLIVGGFLDVNGVIHGFVRSVTGAISVFDVPGAGTTLGSSGALATGVTSFGLSTGYWSDPNLIYHGFLRYPNGAITTFDAPRGGTVVGSSQGTVPEGMNDWGEVVGFVVDDNDVSHGFLRLP